MAEENGLEPINLMLSREELLFVLDLLQARTIAGLEGDPLGELSDEQQAAALWTAARALRARQLAWVRPDGQLALHNNLLAAVGTCAYAQKAVFVYHWGANQELPTPYFGHVRGNDIVAHTRPADVLHLFSRLPSVEALLHQLLTACEYVETPAGRTLALSIPTPAFGQVRSLASSGSTQAALDILTKYTTARDAAQALVDTLATGLRASNLQLLRQSNGQVQRQDYILLQNDQYKWLVTAGEQGAAPLTIKSVSRAEVEQVIRAWL